MSDTGNLVNCGDCVHFAIIGNLAACGTKHRDTLESINGPHDCPHFSPSPLARIAAALEETLRRQGLPGY